MPGYRGPIVDVDVHHWWKNDSEIIRYLPKRWREYVDADPHSRLALLPSFSSHGRLLKSGAMMARSFPEDGSPPGSDYEMLRDQLLDPFNYFRAILTHNLGDFGSHSNPHLAQALCRAANDWNIDTWLTRDDRFYSLVAIPNAVPEHAAEEIRRVGSHPRMVAVLLVGNPLGRPYGDPVYHPIYEAAAEMGLSIAIHASPNFYPMNSLAVTGGPADTIIHANSQRSQQAMHFITSFITHGVFEKYPGLHLLIKEYGIAWLPSVVWRLDQAYDLLRLESPWVRRAPSEYIHDHIKLSTQPIEVSTEDQHALATLLGTVDGIEDLLCFSSDYPHITYDDPTYVARQLPASWHYKVMCANACGIYGFQPPAADAKVTPATAGVR